MSATVNASLSVCVNNKGRSLCATGFIWLMGRLPLVTALIKIGQSNYSCCAWVAPTGSFSFQGMFFLFLFLSVLHRQREEEEEEISWSVISIYMYCLAVQSCRGNQSGCWRWLQKAEMWEQKWHLRSAAMDNIRKASSSQSLIPLLGINMSAGENETRCNNHDMKSIKEKNICFTTWKE